MAKGLPRVLKHIAEGGSSAMGETMGIKAVAAGEGWAECVGIPEERHYNPMQRVHGGFAATLIDATLGNAVATMIEDSAGFGTVELKVNYVRKIDITTSPLISRATVLHAGRTMLTAEAKVMDEAGLLYAHGSGTFLVYPK